MILNPTLLEKDAKKGKANLSGNLEIYQTGKDRQPTKQISINCY
jgi:hypothetical protein